MNIAIFLGTYPLNCSRNWLLGTVTTGCHVMSTLMRDFVHDSGSADGVNNRCLSSSYKKMGNDFIELPSYISEHIFSKMRTDK